MRRRPPWPPCLPILGDCSVRAVFPPIPTTLDTASPLHGWPVATRNLRIATARSTQYPSARLQFAGRADPQQVDSRNLRILQGDSAAQSRGHPLELAQLSQFVFNLVDYRDPDATMTRFVNPDIVSLPARSIPGSEPPSYDPPTLAFATSPGSGNLVQFGMEFSPVAINEVLSYSVYLQGYDGIPTFCPVAQSTFCRAGQHPYAGFSHQFGQPARPDGLEDHDLARRSAGGPIRSRARSRPPVPMRS